MTKEEFKKFKEDHKFRDLKNLFVYQVFYSCSNLYTNNIEDIFKDIKDIDWSQDWKLMQQEEITSLFNKVLEFVKNHRIYKAYH